MPEQENASHQGTISNPHNPHNPHNPLQTSQQHWSDEATMPTSTDESNATRKPETTIAINNKTHAAKKLNPDAKKLMLANMSVSNNYEKKKKVQTAEEKRRVEEAVQDVMVTDEDVNYPLVPFPLVAYPCSFCGKALPSKKQLARHVVEMHKDPTSID